MKKLTAVMIALCLLATGVSALAMTPAEVLGDWYLQYRMQGDDILSKEIMRTVYSVSLNRDKTASATFGGVTRNYRWELGEDRISFYDEENTWVCDAKLQDGMLISEYIPDFSVENSESRDYYFGREPRTVTVPEAVAAAQEDDFYGAWKTVYQIMKTGGGVFDISAAAIVFEVAFAQITASYNGEDYLAMTDYHDGVLTFDAADLGMDGGGDRIVLERTEDPKILRLSPIGDDAAGAYVYLEKTDGSVAAAEPGEPAAEQPAETSEANPEG